MPSRNPKITETRPAPKERAASLRAQAARVIPETPVVPAPFYGGLPDPRPLIEAIDVTKLPLSVLASLYGSAGTISDVAGAVTCRPACMDYGTGHYNAAGYFAEWIADLAFRIMNAVQDEARVRAVRLDDVETRLTILAECEISNGDIPQMRAFARDVQAEADRIEARRIEARG